MRYAYLRTPPANSIFLKRVPMEKKSVSPPQDGQSTLNIEGNQSPQATTAEVTGTVRPEGSENTDATRSDGPTSPRSMKLTELVRAWIANVEWDQEVVYDAEEQAGYLNTHIPIDGTDYRLYVVAEESPEYLSLTLYNPLFIPEDRTVEALRLVNHINQRQRVGRMAIVSNHLQYRALIDMEGCEPGIMVLKNLYRNGYYSMKFWMPHLGKLIFAGVTTRQIEEELSGEAKATRQ